MFLISKNINKDTSGNATMTKRSFNRGTKRRDEEQKKAKQTSHMKRRHASEGPP